MFDTTKSYEYIYFKMVQYGHGVELYADSLVEIRSLKIPREKEMMINNIM